MNTSNCPLPLLSSIKRAEKLNQKAQVVIPFELFHAKTGEGIKFDVDNIGMLDITVKSSSCHVPARFIEKQL